MKHYRPALSWHRRLTNRRGVVFLLAVYFASLMLLILSGIAIQRTMTETRSTQLSRDNAQSFYLAEAALDQALVRLRTEQFTDGKTIEVNGLPGGASFQLATKTANVISGKTIANTRQQLVRNIVGTGRAGTGTGRAGPVSSSSVTGSFLQDEPLSGIWTNGVIVVIGPEPQNDRAVLQADLYSNLGIAGAIRFYGAVDVHGSANVGPPADAPEGFEDLEFRTGYLNLFGDSESTDGIAAITQEQETENIVILSGKDAILTHMNDFIYADGSYTYVESVVVDTASPTVESTAALDSVGYLPPISLPTWINTCDGHITTTSPWTAHIAKPPVDLDDPPLRAGLFPGDLSGQWPASSFTEFSSPQDFTDNWTTKSYKHVSSRNIHSVLDGRSVYLGRQTADGRNIACAEWVDVPGDLIFHGPTLLYVTGQAPGGTGIAFRTGSADDRSHVVAVTDKGRIIPDGVHIVVTKVEEASQAGAVVIAPGLFSGSVYAPQSKVTLSTGGACLGAYCGDYAPMGSLVGRQVILRLAPGSRLEMAGSGPQEADDPEASDSVNLLSWTN